MDFVKLKCSITDSTIWDEDAHTCKLWITLLAMASADGYVASSLPGLARRARFSVEQTKAALERLMAPDEYSRSPEMDGRRVVECEGGWHIVNYRKYLEERNYAGTAKKRAADRARKAMSRLSRDVTDVTANRSCHSESRQKRREEKRVEEEVNTLRAPESESATTDPTPSKPPATTPRARARSRKRTTAPAAEYPPEYATLLQRHQQALHKYQGVVRATVLDAESASVCEQLLNSCGGDSLSQCMERALYEVDLFCQSTDPYVVKRAWAWRVLAYRLDELAVEYTRRTEPEEVRERRRCDLEAETLRQLYGVEVEG